MIRGDTLKVEIKDISHRKIYREKVSLQDKKQVLSVLITLAEYANIDLAKVVEERERQRKEEESWFT